MKPVGWIVIIIVIIIVIAFIIPVQTGPEEPFNPRASPDKQREYFSRKIYNNPLKKCKTVNNSSSTGLLIDSVLICNLLKDFPNSPNIHFEDPTWDATKDEFIFVNLDCTNFHNLIDSHGGPRNILCKTHQAHKILSERLPSEFKVYYTGFLSVDKYRKEFDNRRDYTKFIHVAGKSPYKGTHILVETWMEHPEWPLLTIVMRDQKGESKLASLLQGRVGFSSPNIRFITEFLSDETLVELVNTHGIHICCSENEGFGHYINEAMGAQAVVLYTDMPPMNEQFIPGVNGFPIAAEENGTLNGDWCPRYSITPKGLEDTMKLIEATDTQTLQRVGKAARETFRKGAIEFAKKFNGIIGDTVRIPRVIHHLWIDKSDPYTNVAMPVKYEKYLRSWRKNNPEFELKYWSGGDVFELIKEHYKEYLDFYKSLDPVITKCDFGRFVIILHHGGVYTDLDFYSRRGLGPLLTGDTYFIEEPEKHHTRGKMLCNGFFAAAPQHLFIRGWLDEMMKTVKPPVKDIIQSTGPLGLYNFYDTWKGDPITLGQTCNILSITDDNEMAQECSGVYNNFAVTYWNDGSDWGGMRDNKDIRFIEMEQFGTKFIWQSGVPITVNQEVLSKILGLIGSHQVSMIELRDGQISFLLSSMFRNIQSTLVESNRKQADFMEKMSLLNGLSNYSISVVSRDLWGLFNKNIEKHVLIVGLVDLGSIGEPLGDPMIIVKLDDGISGRGLGDIDRFITKYGYKRNRGDGIVILEKN